jgi:hypothetical protein
LQLADSTATNVLVLETNGAALPVPLTCNANGQFTYTTDKSYVLGVVACGSLGTTGLAF